jgi:hypothetical protein
MMGALEALKNGMLLFGLTTAFLFAMIQEVWPIRSRQTALTPLIIACSMTSLMRARFRVCHRRRPNLLPELGEGVAQRRVGDPNNAFERAVQLQDQEDRSRNR